MFLISFSLEEKISLLKFSISILNCFSSCIHLLKHCIIIFLLYFKLLSYSNNLEKHTLTTLNQSKNLNNSGN